MAAGCKQRGFIVMGVRVRARDPRLQQRDHLLGQRRLRPGHRPLLRSEREVRLPQEAPDLVPVRREGQPQDAAVREAVEAALGGGADAILGQLLLEWWRHASGAVRCGAARGLSA